MTKQEEEFIEDHVIKLVAGNKKGVSIEAVVEYLDYVNRVVYSESDIKPILEKLIEEKRIIKEGSLYLS